METKMNYGKVTVGIGTEYQKDIQITDFIQTSLKDDREITVAELEDGSYTLSVENNPSTGRSNQNMMWLTKESFIGLISTAILYLNLKGEDMNQMLKQAIENDKVNYIFSKNLTQEDELPDREETISDNQIFNEK